MRCHRRRAIGSIGKAANQLNQQVDTAEHDREDEKLAALGQLATAIAHEVRNPLAVIRSATQNLRDTVPANDLEARRACTFITDEPDRLGNLINAAVGVRAPGAYISDEGADSRIVRARPERYQRGISAKQVRVEYPARGEVDAIDANVDLDLIAQVLVGLVDNAIEAVPAGGEVRLEARSDRG